MFQVLPHCHRPSSCPPSQKLSRFNQDGYLLAHGLFNREEMATLQEIAQRDRWLSDKATERSDAEGGSTKLALSTELDPHRMYSAIVRSPRVADTMEALLGDEVYHYHHKMMLKEARIGGAWEWHQDYGYWYQRGCLYPDMGSCLIAVDRATKENGCLQVLRGSHKIGRVDHGLVGGQQGADPDRVAAAVERCELVYCELEPGDALLFHGNLLHRSDQNRSEHPRWSLICCYNTRHNEPYNNDERSPRYEPLGRVEDAELLEIGNRELAALAE